MLYSLPTTPLLLMMMSLYCCTILTVRKTQNSHINYSRFCLEDMDEDKCVANFRFKRNEIPVLGRAMGLPERFTCQQGTVCEQTDALCLLADPQVMMIELVKIMKLDYI